MKRTPLPTIASCDGCGACCTGQAALPIHLVNEHSGITPVRKLPGWLADELRALTKKYMAEEFPPDGSPCIWYDAETKKCRHYNYRPELCRDGVLVGDDACRRWRRTCGIDPAVRYGLKNGRVVRLTKAES